MNDDGFAMLWKKEGTTGFYPDGTTPQGKRSHKELNKDDEDKPGFQTAVGLATRHSRGIANYWRSKHEIKSTQLSPIPTPRTVPYSYDPFTGAREL
jgi:hypothetical protein